MHAHASYMPAEYRAFLIQLPHLPSSITLIATCALGKRLAGTVPTCHSEGLPDR